MTRPFASLAVAFLVIAALATSVRAQPTTEVITVGVRPGVTMRYLSVRDTAPPKAAVILLAGANGAIKLTPSGELDEHLGLNFLIRSREEFARRGLYVAALDVASDQQSGINGFVRLSPLHAQDIEKVIADVKKRADVPVWLVGTSSGTMSAVSAAALLAGSQSRPRGIVLTSTQTVLVAGLCGKTVYYAPLSRIKGPVLIVSHRDDGCTCSPGGQTAGAKLLAAFSATTVKSHQIWEGGDPPRSAPCNALSPHGYLGIEAKVIKSISDWIEKN
jgi:hypothetical protein